MKKFLCKAIFDTENTSNTGFDWAKLKRCILKITENNFEINNRTIAFSGIQKMKLRIVPSAFFIPGSILSISMTNGSTHHFGLRHSKYWERDFDFPIEFQKVTVPLLWVRRTIVCTMILWVVLYIANTFQ